VRSERRPQSRRVAFRWTALLILALNGAMVAYGATPLAARHCECTHGPEVPCDCAHHAAAPRSGRDEDEGDLKLPPCHRARKAGKPGPAKAKTRHDEPAFENRCGSRGPELVLSVGAHVPMAVEVTLDLPSAPLASFVPRHPDERGVAPATPPPIEGGGAVAV
jgi:hypothetical protein